MVSKIFAIYNHIRGRYNQVKEKERHGCCNMKLNKNFKKVEYAENGVFSESTRPRVIVITDISSMQPGVLEPDDTESMVRFLLYANEVDIEGLIACAYKEHGTKPEYIRQVANAYGASWENLAEHDSRYPKPEQLLSCIAAGNSCPGNDQLGEGKDTPGSNLIIAAADKDDPRPLWILLWGGALDLAQAVWRVSHDRTPKEAAAFRKKLRVYSIGDQYDDTGKWMKDTFQDLFYITNYAAFRGMYRFGDTSLSSSAWVQEHVKKNGSALGTLYPDYRGGDPWGDVNGLKEGDTPSVLYIISKQPHNLDDPTQSSWGGQFQKVGQYRYQDVPEGWKPSNDANEIEKYADTIAKWRADYQADFAKRLQWCVK